MNPIHFITDKTNDMNVHFLQTNKFKTNLIVVNIAYDLREETVTNIAILPYILKRGTKNFPTLKKLQEKLDELYGALLFVHVFKRGERQIVQFSLEAANEVFLTKNVTILFDAIHLIGEIITSPLIIEEGFKSDYLKNEKEMLKNRIEGVLDDKIMYAEHQTIKNMCSDEPYRLLEYGQIDDLSNISGNDLYNFYQEWINSAPIDMFVIGDLDIDDVTRIINREFHFSDRNPISLSTNKVNVPVEKEKIITDELDVTQGKLDLGLRTYTTILDEDYIGLLLYNGVLGGYAHSKLFINVREKESLAYYASSKMDSHKGIITIHSGIESQNFDKALAIMKKQLDLLKNGDVSEEEFKLTKSVFSSQLREITDKPRQLVDFEYHSILSGKRRTIDDVLQMVQLATIDQVVKVANKVKLDTVYFLKGKVKEAE